MEALHPAPVLPAEPILEPVIPAGPGRGRKWPLRLAVVVALAVAAGAWVWWSQISGPAPVFATAVIVRGPIEASVSTTGTCNAVVMVQVGSQVSGNIKELHADFNTRVRKGQLVALIDPEPFAENARQAEAAWAAARANAANAAAAAAKAEADVAAAEASQASQEAAYVKTRVALQDAESKLARRAELLRQGLIDQEDYDTAQATYGSAASDAAAAAAQVNAAVHNVAAAGAALRAADTQVTAARALVDQSYSALQQARINLGHTRILAPVDGTVVSRHFDTGQTVAASFQAPDIFDIAQDLTKMQVDTNVDESDIGRLKVGQKATFTVDAYPGFVFRGAITQIRKAPITIQNVVTYDAVIGVSNPDLKLFPGMTATARIVVEQRENALLVPNAALRFQPSGGAGGAAAGPGVRTVYTPDGKRAVAVTVRTGPSDARFTAIEEGALREGQLVIVAGAAAPASNKTTPQPGGLPRRTGI